MNLVSRVLIREAKNHVNGILPVYKPPGMCCIRMAEALKLDLYFVREQLNLSHGVLLVDNAIFLEPFAKGLVTFLIGSDIKRKKNFAVANYVHDVIVEFGVQRHRDCVDGEVISRSPISDVTTESITRALPEFIGPVSQKRWHGYRAHLDNMRDSYTSLDPTNSQLSQKHHVINLFNQMILPPPKDLSSKKPQKYPFVKPNRDTNVESIELLNYTAPFARLRISGEGCFNIRQFAVDLAEKLGTKASLVELIRRKEGPIELDDMRVFQPYEVHLDHYSSRMSSLDDTYGEFNQEYDKLWEGSASKRRIII